MKLFPTIPLLIAFLLGVTFFSASAQSDLTITWGPESTTEKSPALLDAWGDENGYMTLTIGDKDVLTVTYLDKDFKMKRRDNVHLSNDADPNTEVYSFVHMNGKHYLLYSAAIKGKDVPHRLMLQELNVTTYMRVGPPVMIWNSAKHNFESFGYAYPSPDHQKLIVTYNQLLDRKDKAQTPGLGIICFGSDLKESWSTEFRQQFRADAQNHESYAVGNDGSFYLLDAVCTDTCRWQLHRIKDSTKTHVDLRAADNKAISKAELHLAADGSLNVFALWSVNGVTNYADLSTDGKRNYRYLASGICHFIIGTDLKVQSNNCYSWPSLYVSKYVSPAAADVFNTNEVLGGVEASLRGINSIDEESNGSWVVVTDLGATEGQGSFQRHDGLLVTRFSKNGDIVRTVRLPLSQRIHSKGDYDGNGAASISHEGRTWVLYAEDVKTVAPPAVLKEEEVPPQLQDLDAGRLVSLKVEPNGRITRKAELVYGAAKKMVYLGYFLKVDDHTLIGRAQHEDKIQMVRVVVP